MKHFVNFSDKQLTHNMNIDLYFKVEFFYLILHKLDCNNLELDDMLTENNLMLALISLLIDYLFFYSSHILYFLSKNLNKKFIKVIEIYSNI